MYVALAWYKSKMVNVNNIKICILDELCKGAKAIRTP